jgi:hypothetical protein
MHVRERGGLALGVRRLERAIWCLSGELGGDILCHDKVVDGLTG